jgi:hypothetical protein
MPRMRFAARPVLGCWALLCLWLACAGGPAWAATFGELKGRFEQERDKDFSTRYATVREIGALGTLEALRFLERVSVEDDDAGIRSNSLFVMAQVPLPEAAETLVKAFQEREKERSTILSAWTSYRKDALPASIVDEVLSRTDVGMRSNLVRYLGTQQDARFLPEARRFLSQFPGQATSITSALVAVPSPESAWLLLEVYDDERVYDRDTVAPFFAAAKPEVRAVLVQAIGAGREPLCSPRAPRSRSARRRSSTRPTAPRTIGARPCCSRRRGRWDWPRSAGEPWRSPGWAATSRRTPWRRRGPCGRSRWWRPWRP